MCGIAGIIKFNNELVTERELKSMTNVISYRGPDGEGFWINSKQTVGLGHRRLSIIDLSDNASQPMHYLDRYTITFNGEIYNYIELREELLKKGYQFRSASDTEVLLALYDLKKEMCLQELDGMFAFAIWDEKEQTLFCARDRFGEKPFYYFKDKNHFLFGSEMKQLWAAGVPKESNDSVVFDFLMDKAVLRTEADPTATFFQGIRKLEISNYLLLDLRGHCVQRKYWDLDLSRPSLSISFDDAVQTFRGLLKNSVENRMRSDVPIGSSLSGGLDSSAIVCLINELNKNNIRQSTFSARFKDFEKDEGYFIEKIISKVNPDSHFTWPDESVLISDFQKMCYHQEEPFGGSSVFAQWSVMKLARQNQVTVLMDGQGADEILAGYGFYKQNFLHELYYRNPAQYYKEKLAYSEREGVKPLPESKWMHIAKRALKTFSNRPAPWISRPDPAKVALLGGDFAKSFSVRERKTFPCETLNEILYHDLMTRNLEDLLRFADRNSMAHSREIRLPFLSHKLVEFVFSLPAEFKIHNAWTKYILRESMKDSVPEEITWRKDKIAYETPERKWLEAKPMREMIEAAKINLVDKGVLSKKAEISPSMEWQILITANTVYQ